VGLRLALGRAAVLEDTAQQVVAREDTAGGASIAAGLSGAFGPL